MTDENPPAELEQFTGDPSYSVLDALALPLLMFGPPSPAGTAAEWLRITGKDEMSARVMCDHIRSVIYLTMDAAQRAGMMTEAEMRERLAKYAAVRDVRQARKE